MRCKHLCYINGFLLFPEFSSSTTTREALLVYSLVIHVFCSLNSTIISLYCWISLVADLR